MLSAAIFASSSARKCGAIKIETAAAAATKSVAFIRNCVGNRPTLAHCRSKSDVALRKEKCFRAVSRLFGGRGDLRFSASVPYFMKSKTNNRNWIRSKNYAFEDAIFGSI